MELFSERQGLKPKRSIAQIDSMDDALRASLWNALTTCCWADATRGPDKSGAPSRPIWTLCYYLWLDYFKKPVDTLSEYWYLIHEELRAYFFNCKWYEVYDFIEFVLRHYGDEAEESQFAAMCNGYLERELSAYRFVAGKIVQITSKEEIAEVEQAIEASKPLKTVHAHLTTALERLADREQPDYRNSIKESISAVEALCRLITNNKAATLGEALKLVGSKVDTHKALKKAFNNLYGYTSDAGGIRHALMDEPSLHFEDAKFMLVSCSAFVNYLISKASRAGISLQ